MKIAIINGPNLNLIGTRETDVYGNESLETYLSNLSKVVSAHYQLVCFQSNIEGELIDYLQNTDANGIIINAGGYTHTSVSIRDCIAAIRTPVVEVHISNIAGREDFRHTSLLSPVCVGCIFGFGLNSYRIALSYFNNSH